MASTGNGPAMTRLRAGPAGAAWPSTRELERIQKRPKPTFKQRICSKDTHKFRKFIENTTTHGVVRIFKGKSKARRVFWAIVVVCAAGFCLYNIIDQMVEYANRPTATTITQRINRQDELTFPAVTVCNLNRFKRSTYESLIVGRDALSALGALFASPNSVCNNATATGVLNRSNISYRHIQDAARHQAKDLIVNCTYAGEECSHANFSEVLTRLGYCYTFNSEASRMPLSLLKSQGIGIRYGLSLVLNIEQDEYLEWPVRLDAGVKVMIHSQDHPPTLDDAGIAIAPGRNMLIGIQERKVMDHSTIGKRTGRCKDKKDTRGFNFLQERFSYTSSACWFDCLFTRIAEECGCIDGGIPAPPPSSRYHGYSDCSPVELYCCASDYYNRALTCNCPNSCDYTTYNMVSTSYSAFPAASVTEQFAAMHNRTREEVSSNYLAMNVYFVNQDTEVEETANAYKFSALLSDIGGLLGLFLGMSVISMLEFGTWLLDEIKDRCFGVNDKTLEEWYDAAEAELEALERSKKNKSPHVHTTSIRLAEASLQALDGDINKDMSSATETESGPSAASGKSTQQRSAKVFPNKNT